MALHRWHVHRVRGWNLSKGGHTSGFTRIVSSIPRTTFPSESVNSSTRVKGAFQLPLRLHCGTKCQYKQVGEWKRSGKNERGGLQYFFLNWNPHTTDDANRISCFFRMQNSSPRLARQTEKVPNGKEEGHVKFTAHSRVRCYAMSVRWWNVRSSGRTAGTWLSGQSWRAFVSVVVLSRSGCFPAEGERGKRSLQQASWSWEEINNKRNFKHKTSLRIHPLWGRKSLFWMVALHHHVRLRPLPMTPDGNSRAYQPIIDSDPSSRNIRIGHDGLASIPGPRTWKIRGKAHGKPFGIFTGIKYNNVENVTISKRNKFYI